MLAAIFFFAHTLVQPTLYLKMVFRFLLAACEEGKKVPYHVQVFVRLEEKILFFYRKKKFCFELSISRSLDDLKISIQPLNPWQPYDKPDELNHATITLTHNAA